MDCGSQYLSWTKVYMYIYIYPCTCIYIHQSIYMYHMYKHYCLMSSSLANNACIYFNLFEYG